MFIYSPQITKREKAWDIVGTVELLAPLKYTLYITREENLEL